MNPVMAALYPNLDSNSLLLDGVGMVDTKKRGNFRTHLITLISSNCSVLFYNL